MRTALCLGGGASLWSDVAECPVPYNGVVACNDAGAEWSGGLDAWVTLHPKKFDKWIEARKRNGHSPAKRLIAHARQGPHEITVSDYRFNRMRQSASSGIFAAKVALIDLGFDRVILAGVGMLPNSHYFDEKAWKSATHFRKSLREIEPQIKNRIRSCSGWTRLFFGPVDEWINDDRSKSH